MQRPRQVVEDDVEAHNEGARTAGRGLDGALLDGSDGVGAYVRSVIGARS